jgi:hypothetical protein
MSSDELRRTAEPAAEYRRGVGTGPWPRPSIRRRRRCARRRHQLAFNFTSSPVAAVIEDVAGRWLKEALERISVAAIRRLLG